LQRGDFRGAEAAFHALLRETPADPEVLVRLGVCLQAMGRQRDALDAFNDALRARPDFVPALLGAAQTIARTGQIDQALTLLGRAGQLAPGNWAVAGMRIGVLINSGRTGEAGRVARAFLDANPGDPAATVRLGEIRLIEGDLAEAAGMAKAALSAGGDLPQALCLLAETGLEDDPAELLQRIERALSATPRGQPGWIDLEFTAARQCDKLGRHDEAFAYYSKANAARKAQLEKRGEGYDRRRIEQEVETTMASFSRASFGGPRGSESDVPVFIIGMARSGTTLTEQILASHPAVAGGGELPLMATIARRLRREQGYPDALPEAPLRVAAGHYLAHLSKIGGGASRVTDKMPGNLRRLGLIVRMFPNAKIIHCRRDPMDTCVSCFTQNFQFGGSAWTCDLEDTAHQYCLYRRLMEHWRTVLPPGQMLEVDYEDTVADLEGQARELVDFIGLPWDESCLRFHATERAVATPSRAQVRKSIYRSSVGRWVKYGEGVAPLAQGLAACGCSPAEGGEAG